MTPSRSRMISRAWRVGATGSEMKWTKVSGSSHRELGDVGDAVHGLCDAAQEREAVGPHRRILRHDQDVVEKPIHRWLGDGERLERSRVTSLRACGRDRGFEFLKRHV